MRICRSQIRYPYYLIQKSLQQQRCLLRTSVRLMNDKDSEKPEKFDEQLHMTIETNKSADVSPDAPNPYLERSKDGCGPPTKNEQEVINTDGKSRLECNRIVVTKDAI